MSVLTSISRNNQNLENLGGLHSTDIANITDVSIATGSQCRMSAIKPQPRKDLGLSDLHNGYGRPQDYYTCEDTGTWLNARHPQLNGERAIDLIN